jgi:hypothetical protein
VTAALPWARAIAILILLGVACAATMIRPEPNSTKIEWLLWLVFLPAFAAVLAIMHG